MIITAGENLRLTDWNKLKLLPFSSIVVGENPGGGGKSQLLSLLHDSISPEEEPADPPTT